MEHRKPHYKSPAPRDTQAARRQAALEAQRNRRSDTFTAVRGIEDLADLSFADSDDSDDAESQFADADDGADPSATPSARGPGRPGPSKADLAAAAAAKRARRAARAQKKYRAFANRCMYAEKLELDREGLPERVGDDWIALGPVPKGKRCLAVTYWAHNPKGGKRKKQKKRKPTNTILLSRIAAKPLGRFLTPFPPGCVLDCVFDPSEGRRVLWVLDVLRWKEQSYVDCEAEFRFFWRDTQLSQLPAQPAPPLSPPDLLVARVPALPATPPHLLRACASAAAPAASVTARLVPRGGAASDGATFAPPVDAEVPMEPDGLLLYLKAATYESGHSVLAAWVPKADDRMDDDEEVGPQAGPLDKLRALSAASCEMQEVERQPL